MDSKTTYLWWTCWLVLGASLAAPRAEATPLPRIDPTGQRLFVWPGSEGSGTRVPAPAVGGAAAQQVNQGPDRLYLNRPGIKWPWYDCSMFVSPGKIIAPVGSEVVLQAGVCGKDGHLMANQPVEWTINPGSVGHFLDYGRKAPLDYLLAPFQYPSKVDATHLKNTTSSWAVYINRGTPPTGDDVYNMRGQAWTTITSPVEGTTHITAYSPQVYNWDVRKQTVTVYWIDAQWIMPPPAINPAGTRHTFTTTVMRQSNQSPLSGWIVRYEITGGPPAGFAPDGARVMEVTSNSLGQASVELFQQQPTPGTNTISVQVIRPGEMSGGDGTRIVVGQGQTQKTWSGAGLSIRKTGPAEAAIGAMVKYRIVVENPGDLAASGVVVTDQLTQGLTFVSANPPGQPTQQGVVWQLGTMQPREGRAIEVTFRADQPGILNNCASVRSGDGQTAQDCVATTVQAPTIEVSMIAPNDAIVGQEVTFQIVVANRSQYPASGLMLIDRFDEGLQHRVATSPIENRDLGTIGPGESKPINVTFRVTQPGRWCNVVEVYGDGVLKGTAQACVYAVMPATGPGTGVTPPATGAQPVLAVRKTGPTRRSVGDVAEFSIQITNNGQAAATNLKIVDSYDTALRAVAARDGYTLSGRDLVWQLNTLPPGGTYEIRINCLCEGRVDRACNRVTVTSAEGARADGEACLQIAGPATPLSMTLADLTDPVTVGNELGYEIRVTNFADQPDRNVALVVTLPPEVSPLALQTSGPGQLRFEVVGQVIRFEPVAEIRPNETLVYRIRGLARTPGSARLNATLTSANMPAPVSAEERTTIFDR